MPLHPTMNDNSYIDRVEECRAFLQDTLPYAPQTIIQLGTGLGSFGSRITADYTLAFDDIPHFPRATVAGHRGNLILGTLDGHRVAVLQGRFHYYEGYTTKEVALPVRVLSLLGAQHLIVTNAAGGLNPAIHPGSIMVIHDHLNFLGESPLRGPNVDSWGPRFPDFSRAYDPDLIQTALHCGKKCAIENITTGVYVCIPGPNLETPAETRFLRQSGADAVGMSSIPEILVARHGGLKVLGLSVISNVNDPDNFQAIALDDIIAAASRAVPRLERLIAAIVATL
ncbi:MAG: purine-nucleoside phosphorylase [Desulfopila sp.]